MSVMSGKYNEVEEFFNYYVNHDSDWQTTCEHMGTNPYTWWSDEQWELWNKLNDEYEIENPFDY